MNNHVPQIFTDMLAVMSGDTQRATVRAVIARRAHEQDEITASHWNDHEAGLDEDEDEDEMGIEPRGEFDCFTKGVRHG